jgi:uncharacterized ParB-like nuclease family protein
VSAAFKSELLPLAQILRDPALNCRAAGVDEAIATEYAEAIGNGAKLPPVVVFKEGETYRLADGWHRMRAHELAGKTEIVCDVRKGDERECRLYAVGANASHGARRTKADRWRAVEMLLRDPAWAIWSDREIAKQAAVDPKFVAPVRASLAPTVDNPQLTERKGADGKVRKAPKPKKGRKAFDSARAAKEASKELAAIAKRWPPGEPITPLLEAVQAWIAARAG